MTAEERRWLKLEVSRRAKRRAILRSQRERWLRYFVHEPSWRLMGEERDEGLAR